MKSLTQPLLGTAASIGLGLPIAHRHHTSRKSPTEASGKATVEELEHIRWSGWIELPSNFKPFKTPRGQATNWLSRTVPLLGGTYSAAFGPSTLKGGEPGEPAFYAIDIETPIDGGARVVSSLSFSMDYVTRAHLRTPPGEVVTLDPETRVVTFDLGASVFRFQLPPE